jgi:two-component system, OmpR family, sensor kinase
MFTSLRSRLLASYVLLTLLVLAIVTAAAIVFLLRFPSPTRQVLAKLAQAVEAAERLPGIRLDDNQALVRAADTAFDARFIVVDRSGAIVADSRPGGGLPTRLRRGIAGLSLARSGTFLDAAGTRWLFVVRPLGADRGLAAAEVQPAAGIGAIFADQVLPLFFQAGLLALVLSIVLAWLISRWVSAPLQDLVQGTRKVAEGEFDYPIARAGPQELRELQDSFSEMGRRVHTSLKSQRDLVANVSHELRTPLTSIAGYAQAMLDGAASTPEAVRQAASVIQQEAQRMRRLVEGLLDLARLEAGLASMARTRLDLSPLLSAVSTRFAPRAREAGVRLTVSAPAAVPMLGDADRLAQVLDNLVDNALRHTATGGEVRLEASAQGAWAVVRVQDSGPGIPAEALPRLFERFFRADRSGNGVGLGLAICKEIIEAHRGTIAAENGAAGGAVFTARMPLAGGGDQTTTQRRLLGGMRR